MSNLNCNQPCGQPSCGCSKPVFNVEEVPESITTLRFNFQGVSTTYDYENMIHNTQSDTTLSADAIKRVLTYMAERHTDTISAKELGAILHIADIGDVDITGATDNSLFVYQKESDCGQGCQGIDNSWIAWNSSEHQTTSVDTIMGFADDGSPMSLQRPTDTTKTFLIAWDGSNKIRYITVEAFGSIEGKKPLYIDPDTGKLGYEA